MVITCIERAFTMMQTLEQMNPILLAFIATMFTWLLTAIGSSSVFFVKRIPRKVLHVMLGFAAGEMLAASFWSLLNHAIMITSEMSQFSLISVADGFLLGAAFIWLLEKMMPKIHRMFRKNYEDKITNPKTRARMLSLDIIVHYLPEGLAVGIAFGALVFHYEFINIYGALGLVIGLGTQNIVEAAAVSVPLRRVGMSKWQSFYYGVISGIIQPIAGVLGAWIVIHNVKVLPFALAFAAGAMIYAVIEELLPEAMKDEDLRIATAATMIGFTVMMVFKVTLG